MSKETTSGIISITSDQQVIRRNAVVWLLTVCFLLASQKVLAEDKWGYINQNGDWVIKPQFSSASDFIGGCAMVKVFDKEKHKLVDRTIDRHGNSVDEHSVSHLSASASTKSKAAMQPKPVEAPEPEPTLEQSLRNLIGAVKCLFGLEHELPIGSVWSEGLKTITVTDGHDRVYDGYINESGTRVIACQFNFANEFHEGLASVLINNRWFYIDKHGHKIIELPASVSSAGDFKNGIAPVAVGGTPYKHEYFKPRHGARWAFIDKNGKFVTRPLYEIISYSGRPLKLCEGLTLVLVDIDGAAAYGFVNPNGSLVVRPRFSNAHNFSEGLAAVSVGPLGFVTENWEHPALGYGAGSRSELVFKFFRQYRVIGMPKSEIHNLLGQPERPIKALYAVYSMSIPNPNCFRDALKDSSDCDTYILARGPCSHGCCFLNIEYDTAGKVHRYRISSPDNCGDWIYDNSIPYLNQ